VKKKRPRALVVFLYCQNTLEITHAQPIRNAMNPMPISRLIVSFSGAGVAGWSGLCSSVWLSPVPGRPTVVFSAGFHVRHPCGLSVPKNIYRMWLI